MSKTDPFEALRPKSVAVPVGETAVFYLEKPKLATQQDLFEFVRKLDVSGFTSIFSMFTEDPNRTVQSLVVEKGAEIWAQVVGVAELLLADKLSELVSLLLDNRKSWEQYRKTDSGKNVKPDEVKGSYRRCIEMRESIVEQLTVEQAVYVVTQTIEINRLNELGKIRTWLNRNQAPTEPEIQMN